MLERAVVAGLVVLADCTGPAPEPALPATVIQAPGGDLQPSQLVFGVAPALPAADMRREYAGLVAHLSDRLGIPVELRVAESYSGLIDLLASVRVHAALLPPFAYVEAKRLDPGLVLLASQIIDASSTYATYIVSRDDAGIDGIEDLAGRSFAFVDPRSASGYLYARAYLAGLGIVPEAYFGAIELAGDHGRLIDLVLERRVDAGATYATALRLAAVEHPFGNHIRIVAKTGRAPLDAVVASPRLAAPLVASLRTTLLTLSTRTDEGRRVLQGLTAINGFVAVTDHHYDDVRRVARLLDEAVAQGAAAESAPGP